jgi:hypothetical protein
MSRYIMYKEFVTELSHQTSEVWGSHNGIDEDLNILLGCKWDLRSYRRTVHYGIHILFIHQQLHVLLNLEKFNFTLEYT